MLTLEQVRAVNDGFKSGDLNAALRPLEEIIDLRSNELPRLDKSALSALKEGLRDGNHAPIWAEAVLHPNISVRRFARKVFMGLGDEAAPLFDPLRQSLERYWSEEQPLQGAEKPREIALQKAQNEMVDSALELLLRANPEKFLQFYADVVDATPVRVKSNSHDQALDEWQKQYTVLSDALYAEIDRLLVQEWGSEWVEDSNRWKLPSRVLNELEERARAKPEVAQKWDQLGEMPSVEMVVEWNPMQMIAGTFANYLSPYGQTGPQKRVAERLRPVIWKWVYGAFDFESSLEERLRHGRYLMNERGWGDFGGWLDAPRLQREAPALLLRTKGPLREQLEKQSASGTGIYHEVEYQGDGITARLWFLLAQTLGNALRKPYGAKPGEWALDPEVEPEMLRQIIADLDTQQNSYLLSELKRAIGVVEWTRKVQSGVVTDEETPTAPAVESEDDEDWDENDDDEGDDDFGLGEYNLLPEEQIEAIYEELGDTEAAQAKIEQEVKKVEQEIVEVQDTASRVRILVEPPPHPRGLEEHIARLDYWKIWGRALGENGAQKLKEELWGEVAPQLWAHLDARLEAYRRVETDAIEPKIEEMLTKRELKEWRAEARRDKRAKIEEDISDISTLLQHMEGWPARIRMIEMFDRPSCRDLRDEMEMDLIHELDDDAPDPRKNESPAAYRDRWKLGEEWAVVLTKAQAQLKKAKEEWERNELEEKLAVGYYRRGQFERFKEIVTRTHVFPRAVADALIALDDYEAWHVLIGVLNRWQADGLTEFWQEQLKEPQRKNRAVEAVIHTLTLTNNEDVAHQLLQWVKALPPHDVECYSQELEKALESALVSVKKWAMTVLAKLPDAEFDRELAATTASEALWSDNLGLAKDAAKFLSQLGLQAPDVTEVAWQSLCDATALDNVAVAEAVYRALSQLKAKDKGLELTDAACEKLGILVGAQADRFTRFQKRLTS